MALANHTPATWTDILSTTMHNYHKTLTDNIFNTRPLLQYYMGSGRVKTLNGGISIVEPVMYAEGDADSYAEWDQVVVTPKNTATAAQYDWKQLYATIAISGLEEAQNSGREQIINLLEAKISQAEETLKRRLNGMGPVPALRKRFTRHVEIRRGFISVDVNKNLHVGGIAVHGGPGSASVADLVDHCIFRLQRTESRVC